MSTSNPKLNIHTKGPVNEIGTYDPSKHLGYLGAFFGGVENAPTSISGFIVILLIVIGGLISFCKEYAFAMDYWKAILPIVTALFGYLFGKSRK